MQYDYIVHLSYHYIIAFNVFYMQQLLKQKYVMNAK